MNISSELRTAHEKLSRVSARFLDFAAVNPKVLKKKNLNFSVPGYSYLTEVQSWPTFINAHTRKVFETASVEIIKLIGSLLQRIFNMDPVKMAPFYNIPADKVKYSLMGVDSDYLRYIIGRGDFVLTQEGPKCVEYNIATNLGGWQLDILRQMYLMNPFIVRFIRDYQVRLTPGQTLCDAIMEHMISAGKNLVADSGNMINTAMVSINAGPSTQRSALDNQLQIVYKNIMKQKLPQWRGEVFICNCNELEVKEEGLFLHGKRITVILNTASLLFPEAIMDLFARKRLTIIDSPSCEILTNKLNLALLSMYRDSSFFSPAEREMIHRYVPWSRKLEGAHTDYQDQTVDLPVFTRDNQEKLVLKPANELGGKGVMVGRFVPRNDWEVAVDNALAQGNWMVQEYHEPVQLLYRCGEEGYGEHTNVAGLFVFGHRYIGGFMRVHPLKDCTGVVSCHLGATISSLIEVEE